MSQQIKIEEQEVEVKESPDYLRMSLSSAMALHLRGGRFYRNAKSPCVNLLMTYNEGCFANTTPPPAGCFAENVSEANCI